MSGIPPNPPPKWRQVVAAASEEAFGYLHTASPAQEAPFSPMIRCLALAIDITVVPGRQV